MKKLIIEKFPRILKNKKRLEEKLEVKINTRGKEIIIDGEPENEYIAETVIEALNLGFPLEITFLIKEEDYIFEIINIKEYTKKKDFVRIRSRIIGTKGKTLKTLTGLTKCHFEIKDNRVGIIGQPENIKNAQEAIIAFIRGSKHSNVYFYLEKHQIKSIIDLGLKEPKKKRSKTF